jgi:hypothetical protein
MKLAGRSLFALLVTAIITVSPAPANAAQFTFQDDADGGIIIWDGALDVATMQNNCPAVLCITTELGAIAPEAVRVLVNMSAAATFDSFSLNLVLSAPSAGFPLGDCAVFSISCLSAEDFLEIYGGANYSGFECLDNGNVPLDGCPSDPTNTHSVARLPLELIGSDPIGDGSQFRLFGAGLSFLTSNLAFFQAARVGFELNLQLQQPTEGGQAVVPFTLRLSLQDASAPAAVPEPGTMLLLGSGLAGLGGMAWRRHRRG